MLRRFSLFQLVFALVVVVLWSAVWLDREARDVARAHVHNALVPYSRSYSYDSFDDTRAEDRIMRASVNSREVRSLIKRFPNDTAVLAIYVRRSKALLNFHWDGPLRAHFTAWSVQISQSSTSVTTGMLPGSSSPDFPKPKETDEILHLIERGRELEPQNTYWDWMEMAALAASGRDNELPAVLRRASFKQDWNDHVTDDMRAQGLWNERHRSLFGPAAKTFGYSGTLLHHLSLVREVTRSLAQQVMGLRLQRRDDDALQLGLQTMRLARVLRLESNLPITSTVGASCERIIMRSARVPLGKRVALPFPSPSSALAKDSESLLFLAQAHSPIAAREIASEWTLLNGWGMDSVTDLYGGIVPRESLERVGWTTRAASYGFMALPAAVVVWLGLCLTGWRWSVASAQSPYWGSFAGLLLLGGFWTFDWVTRAIAMRGNPLPGSFCGMGYTAPEEVLLTTGSLLEVHGLVWAGTTLWLGMFAFSAAFSGYGSPRKEVGQTARVPVGHPIDILWNSVKWLWRGQGRLWSFLAPLWILAGALVPVLAVDSSAYANNPLLRALALAFSLAVWPVAVGIRQIAIFLRTRQRSAGPARFVAAWRATLSSFVVVSLLILPTLIWAQSRFERDFERQIAPIEWGQMVGTIQRMRGIAMR